MTTETIAAQRLAKLREAVRRYENAKYSNNAFAGVVWAACAYIEALDQPAPESNNCAECGRLEKIIKALAEQTNRDINARIHQDADIDDLKREIDKLRAQPPPSTAN